LNDLQAQDDARPADKAYWDMLDNTGARQKYFTNIAVPDEADHKEIASVKNKINKLIQ